MKKHIFTKIVWVLVMCVAVLSISGGCAGTRRNNTDNGVLMFLGDVAGAAAGAYVVEKQLENEHELLEQQGKLMKKLMKKFH